MAAVPSQFSLPVIDLQRCEYVASGRMKDVYLTDVLPFGVLKVVKPRLVDENGQFRKHRPIKKLRRQGVYRHFRREIVQYIALCRRHYSENRFSFPIATPYALVPTTGGLGLLTEKVIGPDGGLARPIAGYARTGQIEDKHLAALDQFFIECIGQHVVFGEVNWDGLLYTESRSGRPEIVLVDGIGDKNIIPFRAMSARLNARNIVQVRERILRQIDEEARKRSGSAAV
jgi:hypothetical protein